MVKRFKTLPSHGSYMGSNPVGVTNQKTPPYAVVFFDPSTGFERAEKATPQCGVVPPRPVGERKRECEGIP